jgi:uncharacterized hydrophobic protein (TIGR00271 family)
MNIKEILSYFSLKGELESHAEIQHKIETGIAFRGVNLWILVFAIFLASLGLNVNSTAVIIGAMLVSPLMGPIMGMGFAMGIQHFDLLKHSAKNFGFAIATALITSTLYFIFSPIHEAHSELLARTKPNFYDVLIALFGGLAGIFGTASKNKGNVLPGVAIATALMPPLCTAGYGISDLNGEIFLGAIFLFLINTVFIAWSSYLGTKFFRLPLFHYLEPEKERKAKQLMYGIILITLLPSIYFAYNAIERNKFQHYAERFMKDNAEINGNYLIKHALDEENKLLTLTYAGKGLDAQTLQKMTNTLADYKLSKEKVIIKQSLKFLDASSGQKTIGELQSAVKALETEVLELKQMLKTQNDSNYLDTLITD